MKTLPDMSLLAMFVIFPLWLVPSNAAVARPASPMAPAPGGPTAPADGYRWPLAGTPVVTRPFEPPPQPWLPASRSASCFPDTPVAR